MRRMHSGRTVGRKVGYANKALWRAFKLDPLVWAHMYARNGALRTDECYVADNRANVLAKDRTRDRLQDEAERIERPRDGNGA